MNMQSHRNRIGSAVAGALLGLGVWGCSSGGTGANPQMTIAPRVYLGGEALAQKKLQMRRVHADMIHLHGTHERLGRLQKTGDRRQLEDFIRPYLDRHVGPLVEVTEGEGWNSELRLLEANLLFAEAALRAAMRDENELEAVIASLADRFDGYESMLVEYPIGGSSTLEHAVADLRKRRVTQ